MKRVLFLDACRPGASRTRELAQIALRAAGGALETVSLFGKNLPPLDEKGLLLRDRGDFSGPEFALARQFAACDEIVIAAPYWDLSFPACLKQYIEAVCVCGLTFVYTPNGTPKSLCRCRKASYITTAGGQIGEKNFGFSYLKALFSSFFGVETMDFYAAEGLDLVGNDPNFLLNEAKKSAMRCFFPVSERLLFRELCPTDYPALCRILQDEQTMTAYEGAFSDSMAQEWLDRQMERYAAWGFGSWAVIERATGELIGQCGLTLQPWRGGEVLEAGYLFRRDRWHCGFATEAVRACLAYARQMLEASEVCAIIRDTNLPSQRVALRCGMRPKDREIRHYRGVDMPHTRYILSFSEKQE